MKKLLFTISILTITLLGCSKLTTEEYLAQAQSQIDDNDTLAAIVTLKNALGNDGSNYQARLMLGNSYLLLGRAVDAEKELSVALKLTKNTSEVLPLLAKSLSLQEKYVEISDLITEFSEVNVEAIAALRFYETLGFFKQGLGAKASRNLDKIDTDSSNRYDLLTKAYFFTSQNNFDDAIEIIEKLTQKNDTFDEAYFLLGQIYLTKREFPAAVRAFSNYVSFQPDYFLGHFFLADAMVKNGEFNEARKHINMLLRINAEQPYVNQLRGMVEFDSQNFEQALLFSSKSINNGLSNYTNNLVAGLSAYELKKTEQAYQYLQKIKSKLNTNPFARNVFVSTQMQLGYDAEAATYVRSLDDEDTIDSGILTVLGMNLLNSGEKNDALEVVSLIDDSMVQDPATLTKLGLFKQLVGDDTAIDLLERSLKLDGSATQTRLAIINDLILQKNYDDAIKLAKQWITDEPGDILPLNLISSIYIKLEDLAKVEEFLEKALIINPDNPLSLIYFANKEKVNGNDVSALKRMKQLVKSKPDYLQGWYAYYRLAESNSAKLELFDLLSKSMEGQSGTEMQLFFAQMLIEVNSLEKAKDLLKRMVENKSAPELSFYLYGKVLEMQKNSGAAVEAYKKWRNTRPQNIRPWLMELAIYEQAGNVIDGLKVINDATLLFPGNENLQILSAQFNILAGNVVEAKNIISKWKGNKRFDAASEILQAQIYLQNSQFSLALSGFRNFYEIKPIGKNALVIFEIYKKLGRLNEGLFFLEERLKAFPNDKITKAKLALEYLSESPERSIKYYQSLLEETPQDIVFLNNVSWAYHKVSRDVDGLVTIQKAYSLNPKNVSVIDTYLNILKVLGMSSEADEILNKALTDMPSNPTVAALKSIVEK